MSDANYDTLMNSTLASLAGVLNSDKSDNANFFLAITALVVSLIALIATTLQVVHQYLESSTHGFRRCRKRVMGLWGTATKRKYRIKEFRIEVRFQTPVIFTAEPGNLNGPLTSKGNDDDDDDGKIYDIDGSKDSHRDTHTDWNEQNSPETSVHTANDELASWVIFLRAIQREERDSRKWEDNEILQRKADVGPPRVAEAVLADSAETTSGGRQNGNDEAEQDTIEMRNLPPVISQRLDTTESPLKSKGANRYTIVHQIQKKKRSWDFMPAGATKPFATTTVCHLVEMMALMGLHWKQFKLQDGDMSADGNGYVLSTTKIHGLGLMAHFAVTSKSEFGENRVIPCTQIKSLSFGIVPSILDRPLEVGRPELVMRTLATFSCEQRVITEFSQKNPRTYMFSMTFEIVAMLAKVFRVRGSLFRLLPNPTSDGWIGHITKISWVEAMNAFQEKLDLHLANLKKDSTLKPHALATRVSVYWNDNLKKEWALRETSWKKLPPNHKNKSTEVNDKSKLDKDFAAKMDLELRELIHSGLDEVDKFFAQGSTRTEVIESHEVAAVMAAHIKYVIAGAEDLEGEINKVGQNSSHNVINYYFDTIRASVEMGRDSRQTEEKGKASDRASISSDPKAGNDETTVFDGSVAHKEVRMRRDAIWIGLCFRMISWSLLHDFDMHDKLLVPSELMGSRMPVYIG